jgi:hypothetical protein
MQIRPHRIADDAVLDARRNAQAVTTYVLSPKLPKFFQHRLVFDRSSLTRWRNRMGEERLQALLQESLSVATRTKAIKPSELSRVIVDTTVQPENVTFPTDAKLLNRAREKLVRLAQLRGMALRQSYARVGKFALIQHQRYAHAKQFKRANRMLRKLRTYRNGFEGPRNNCDVASATHGASVAPSKPRPTKITFGELRLLGVSYQACAIPRTQRAEGLQPLFLVIGGWLPA